MHHEPAVPVRQLFVAIVDRVSTVVISEDEARSPYGREVALANDGRDVDGDPPWPAQNVPQMLAHVVWPATDVPEAHALGDQPPSDRWNPQTQEHGRKGGVAVLVFVEGGIVQVETGVQHAVGTLSVFGEREATPHVGVVLVTDEVEIVHAVR